LADVNVAAHLTFSLSFAAKVACCKTPAFRRRQR